MKNRLKCVEISSQVIADLLKLASKNALPNDAKIIRVNYSSTRDCFELIVYSRTFPGVPEATLIPRLGTPIISSGMLK